jgi:hypothetical protein
MNPTSLSPTESVVIDGNEEHYFSKTVTQRFPKFLIVIAACNIAGSFILSFFLTDPTFKTSKLGTYFYKNTLKDVDNEKKEISQKEENINVKNHIIEAKYTSFHISSLALKRNKKLFFSVDLPRKKKLGSIDIELPLIPLKNVINHSY